MPNSSEKISTRERILETALMLFVHKGPAGTSMREITKTAGVNLAAVNYHFGSKDGLMSEVFDRHLSKINNARVTMLDAVEASSPYGPPVLESVLEAFIRPFIVCALVSENGSDSFLHLMGRCLSEPPEYFKRHILPHYESLIQRYSTAIANALPNLSREEIFRRLCFVAGALHYALYMRSLDEAFIRPDNPLEGDELVRELIAFATAGMRADRGRNKKHRHY